MLENENVTKEAFTAFIILQILLIHDGRTEIVNRNYFDAFWLIWLHTKKNPITITNLLSLAVSLFFGPFKNWKKLRNSKKNIILQFVRHDE